MRKVMLLAPENICDILQAVLNHKNRTLPCSNAAVGREILDQMPDALILDLFLEGTDGMTFLRENTDALPPVIIVLSRFLNNDLFQALAELCVSSVILLPCRTDYIVEQLSTLL